ncbi:HAD-IA family hydrolase [Kordiimonas sp. SCSIO 12603]|uniref:HAD-IA family hydrolase n=1 Tax=Kordiimonas sp. SCSIO 12603 TaxID=2829596 RepID=UPI0021025133|nr:HAD-IA family hydrolase [Kordiimonas sp. SCSIO 12603]UTW56986.1 HAD-IA family hydrolase [Kordiimonas sp. SCSIO 12603]
MTEFNKLVIFDCDGTLVDSQHMIIGSMHDTFDKAGFERKTDQEVRAIVGLSLHEAIASLLPHEGTEVHAAMTNDYKQIFYERRTQQGAGPDPLYDGTREALVALNEAGYLLGVATGSSRRGLDRVLAEHDLASFFVTLQTADGHPSKPHPSMIFTAIAEAGSSPESAVMVGDTSYDIMMSVKAGTTPIGVNWGYHSEDLLADVGAKHIASHYNQIPALVKAAIGD